MTDCEYCHKSLDIAPNNDESHNICLAEYCDRIVNACCAKCGDDWGKSDNGMYCGKCNESSEFEGYLGPPSQV